MKRIARRARRLNALLMLDQFEDLAVSLPDTASAHNSMVWEFPANRALDTGTVVCEASREHRGPVQRKWRNGHI